MIIRFGYGATPITVQGWLATAIFVIAVSGMRFVTSYLFGRTAVGMLAFILSLIVLLIAFLILVRRKTEGGLRWRMGED